jgi:methylated-DNA-[protein]-cysteine S-methyltransferase
MAGLRSNVFVADQRPREARQSADTLADHSASFFGIRVGRNFVREHFVNTTSYCEIESPIGPLLLVRNDSGLLQVNFCNGRHRAKPEASWTENPQPLKETACQLKAYFAGTLQEFDLPLAPQGTHFQLGVWKRLCEIPYGETISYGELARRIGNPNASRAVGLANGSNPIPIIIPCHRVIGSNGKMTGYGGGLPIKEKLLALERRQLRLL